MGHKRNPLNRLAKQERKKAGKPGPDKGSVLANLLRRADVPIDQKPGREPATIDEALEKFAFSDESPGGKAIPDYFGFMSWVADSRKADAEPGVVFNRLHDLNAGGRKVRVDILRIVELKSQYPSELAQGVAGDAGQRLKTYNKLKLLMRLSTDDPRWAEMERAIEQYLRAPETEETEWEELSQSQLRLLFFNALENKNWRTAFMILGKLKKAAHDSGELAYLEALANFHSNDFEACLKRAKSVSQGDPDFVSAFALHLESLAFLGRTDGLITRLCEGESYDVSPMFWRYLLQVVISNADDPRRAIQDLQSAGERGELKSPTNTPEHDPFTRGFNRYSCGLAVRLAEFANAHELEATLQTVDVSVGDARVDTTAASNDIIEQLFGGADQVPIQVARVFYALLLDHELLKEVLDSSSDERFMPIVKRLLNVPYEVDLSDHKQALEAQLRLGGLTPFVANVARLVGEMGIGHSKAGEVAELVQSAYVYAFVQGNSELPLLRAFLEALPDARTSVACLDEQARERGLLDWMTPMGRQSYLWSQHALDKAESEPSPAVVDGGMISLGFFRILELEMNSRLLRNLEGNAKLAADLGTTWKRTKNFLKSQDGQTSKNRRRVLEKTIQSWDQLIPAVTKVCRGSKSGLELGALERLLSKVAQETGPDTELKTLIASALKPQLTIPGLEALRCGELADLISSEVRERFRNPPAHTRFLPVRVARQCKEYVEASLRSLRAWVAH